MHRTSRARRTRSEHVLPLTNTGETRGARFRLVKSLEEALERARAGGPERHREKSAQQGKLPVRERIERLVDPGSFAEEALLANWESDGFGADGVVTGMAKVGGIVQGRPSGTAAI